ncbi:MAG: hypothetical protein IT556_09885, partial [Acetobacteraceae bacterium]|nr:hypothetical protein [Acetobacteraceae bacterium]
MNELTPAYRAPMAARSNERRTRRVMLIGAAAAVGVFAAVLGLRALVSGARAPHEVPLVAADERPTRVRPDNPGGMTVPNQDKLIFERAAGRAVAPQQAALAPPPEVPQALPRPVPPQPAQQLAQQPAQQQVPTPAPAAQPAAARLPPPVPASQTPASQTPAAQAGAAQAGAAQAGATQAPASPAAAPAAAPVPGGRVAVQLAAVGS